MGIVESVHSIIFHYLVSKLRDTISLPYTVANAVVENETDNS